MADLTRTQMTIEEFRQLPESIERIELIHGELMVSPTPQHKHQRLVLGLATLVDNLKKTGEVIISPMDVYLSDTDVVQPDVFWVSGPESNCKLGADDYWHGAPDLVIEVLSPGTALRDKTVKFDLYQKHGTREYWLVDPDAQYIEVRRLNENRFARIGVFGPADKFESMVLGQMVEGATVFK